ncbi:MAG: Phage tail protein [Candidatus Omnitrophica bacterium ADurb.Bin277]|nr:MAG: Phage tail protein [Candidatus Omnitrophica bacterium ADurb.Bin277]
MSFEIKLGSYSFGNYVDTFEIQQDSRVEQVAIPRRHGYMSDVAYRGGMSIRIGGLIYCDDYNDTRTAFNLLKNAFNIGKANLTVFSDRQIEVQKASFTSSYEDQDLRRIRWDAELVSDAYGFEDVDQTEDENIILASPQTDVVVNPGNLETRPVIRITAGADEIASGLRVDNLTSGKYFIFNQAIPAGTYIEIDTENLTVVNNTGTNKINYFSGDFFELEAGNNSIQFTGTLAQGTLGLEAGDTILLENGDNLALEGTTKMKFTFRGKYDGV